MSQSAHSGAHRLLGSAPLRQIPKHSKVAYFGPENTNTHAAALLLFGDAPTYTPFLTKSAVFDAVESGKADSGVVPIENSTEGVVRETIDCLISKKPMIRFEFETAIEHCLVAQESWNPQSGRIASHPQALAQCRKWLDQNYANNSREAAASTASAAALAAQDPTVAAISNRLAGQALSLHLLHGNIADQKDNTTRFICIGAQDEPASGHDKTTLVLTAPHERGALLAVLAVFDRATVNLLRIESRPLPNRKWEYAFVVDVEGHRTEEPLKSALDELSQKGRLLRIVGSYHCLDALPAP